MYCKFPFIDIWWYYCQIWVGSRIIALWQFLLMAIISACLLDPSSETQCISSKTSHTSLLRLLAWDVRTLLCLLFRRSSPFRHNPNTCGRVSVSLQRVVLKDLPGTERKAVTLQDIFMAFVNSDDDKFILWILQELTFLGQLRISIKVYNITWRFIIALT